MKKVKEIEKRQIWERKVKRDLWRLFIVGFFFFLYDTLWIVII